MNSTTQLNQPVLGKTSLIALVLAGVWALAGCNNGTTVAGDQDGSTTNNNNQTGDCGNNVREGGEDCDGDDLNGQTCATLNLGTGNVTCTANCTFDISGCSEQPDCGNQSIEYPEDCDGAELDGQTCESLGYGTGTLACTDICEFNLAGCQWCGNGAVDGSEECDGADLDGQTCEGLGFGSGTLACDNVCGFDTSGCSLCGNGTVDTGEQCDTTDLDGQTCVSRGYTGGFLACDASCQFDESGCGNCDNPDVTDPAASNHVPAPETRGAPADTMIQVDLFDACGIDSGITMRVTVTPLNGPVQVYSPTPVVTGSGTNVTVSYDHPGDFPAGAIVEVLVSANDVNSNTLVETWRFSVVHQMSLYSGHGACIIDESQPTTNVQPVPEGWPVGGGSGNDQRYIIHFTPEVPAGALIFSATLNVAVGPPGSTTAATVECYRLNAEPDGMEATWTDRMTTPTNIPWTAAGANGVPDDRQGSPAASIAIAASTPAYTPVNDDVTGLVSEWAAGADHFGIICTNGGDDIVPICSPFTNYPPRIDLTYGPPLP